MNAGSRRWREPAAASPMDRDVIRRPLRRHATASRSGEKRRSGANTEHMRGPPCFTSMPNR
jgi:hypothetical protein